jgi:hypothetical protein
MKKNKVKKPKTNFSASKRSHGLVLESYGAITCECDQMTTFARSIPEIKKLAKWLLDVAEHLEAEKDKQ